MENTSQPNNDDVNALETAEKPIETAQAETENKPKKRSTGNKIQGLISHLNIYLLLFILIVIISVVVVFIGIQRSKKEAAIPDIATTPLTTEELAKLKSSDAKVGDPKQTLTIESNAIFSGKVLVRDSLDVAGGLKLGGSLSVSGITVSGTSTFDQFVANQATISGDSNLQGQLNVQKTLTVGGGATFGGPISAPQVTAQSLQLNGDLTFSRHIDAGGAAPGISNGTALGGGGTTSLSGTDTAGTVAINTGGGPPAGCFATVSFNQKFNSVPHVVITPVGSGGAGINYYVTRTTTSFSICTTNGAPGGTSFAFDYIVIE